MIVQHLRKASALSLAFLFFAILGGCSKGGAESGSQSEPAITNQSGLLEKVKPDFTLEAKQYFEENRNDIQSANKKYGGKIIELRGVVSRLHFVRDKPLAFSLNVGGSRTENELGLLCGPTESIPWGKVVPGQEVKVSGKARGSNIFAVFPNLLVTDITIVELGPNPAISISATELGREYGTHRESTLEKYNEKYLIVGGEVIKKDKPTIGAGTIYLKGKGKIGIVCNLDSGDFDQTLVDSIEVGKEVKLLGQFVKIAASKAEVVLMQCLPIKDAK